MTELQTHEDHSPAEFDDEEDEMDFWDHIGELRKRLIISILAVGTCAIFGWYISQETFMFLSGPFEAG